MHRVGLSFSLSFSFRLGFREGLYKCLIFMFRHLLVRAEQETSEFIGVDLGMLDSKVPNFSKFIGFYALEYRLAIKLANSMVDVKRNTKACSSEGICRDQS